jgi:hypothetical protein
MGSVGEGTKSKCSNDANIRLRGTRLLVLPGIARQIPIAFPATAIEGFDQVITSELFRRAGHRSLASARVKEPRLFQETFEAGQGPPRRIEPD